MDTIGFEKQCNGGGNYMKFVLPGHKKLNKVADKSSNQLIAQHNTFCNHFM